MKRKKTIKLEVEECEVVATFIPPTSRRKSGLPGALFIQDRGNYRKDCYDLAEAVAKQGIVGLAFDFRGHGDSEGDRSKQSLRDALKDSRAAIKALKQEEMVDENKIGIFGRKFGGYVAAVLSAEEETKSLVLSHPAVYKDEWLDLMYRNFPLKDVNIFKTKFDFDASRSIQAIKDFEGSLLVLKGEGSETLIPEDVVEAYYKAGNSTKKLDMRSVRGAARSPEDPEMRQDLNNVVADWFSKTL